MGFEILKQFCKPRTMNNTDSKNSRILIEFFVVNKLTVSDGAHFLGIIITSFGAKITYHANDSASNML